MRYLTVWGAKPVVTQQISGVEGTIECDSNSLVLLHITFSGTLNPGCVMSRNWLYTKLSRDKLLSVPSWQKLHILKQIAMFANSVVKP